MAFPVLCASHRTGRRSAFMSLTMSRAWLHCGSLESTAKMCIPYLLAIQRLNSVVAAGPPMDVTTSLKVSMKVCHQYGHSVNPLLGGGSTTSPCRLRQDR